MDKITLRGIVAYGHHGVMAEEKALGQRFIVHLTLYLDTSAAAASDSVEDTVNYADVYRDVKAVVEGAPKNLIETVAATIADKLLKRYSKLEGVRVELEKPSAPIPGPFDTVSITVERWRKDSSVRAWSSSDTR